MSVARRILRSILPVLPLLFVPSALHADPVTFQTRALFEAAARTTLVDGYSHPGYRSGNVADSSDLDIHTDASMTAVFGETSYRTTGRTDFNIVFAQNENPKYCAGCNGSFALSFTSTSIGTAAGVEGVAFNFTNAVRLNLYGATVTFGDGSVASYRLPFASTGFARDSPGFWGIAAPELIRSIHFGPDMGRATDQSGSFAIDDLTLAADVQPVPEPASMMLLGTGLAALAVRRRRR